MSIHHQYVEPLRWLTLDNGERAVQVASSATRDALDRFSETGKKVAELTDAHVTATANAVINGVSRQPTRAQRNVRKAA